MCYLILQKFCYHLDLIFGHFLSKTMQSNPWKLVQSTLILVNFSWNDCKSQEIKNHTYLNFFFWGWGGGLTRCTTWMGFRKWELGILLISNILSRNWVYFVTNRFWKIVVLSCPENKHQPCRAYLPSYVQILWNKVWRSKEVSTNSLSQQN